MKTREETTKARKELMIAERQLTESERPKKEKPNLMPFSTGSNKKREHPKTMSQIPDVVHLPKKKIPKHENKVW
jgi:hypothetical protein